MKEKETAVVDLTEIMMRLPGSNVTALKQLHVYLSIRTCLMTPHTQHLEKNKHRI